MLISLSSLRLWLERDIWLFSLTDTELFVAFFLINASCKFPKDSKLLDSFLSLELSALIFEITDDDITEDLGLE